MYLEQDAFFEVMALQGRSLGFDDIEIASPPSQQVIEAVETGNFDVDIVEPDLSAPWTQHTRNPLPLVSAAMDTVTEAETAIVMAEAGGRGVIHAGLNPEKQFRELQKVKKRLNGFIEKPEKLTEDMTFESVRNVMAKFNNRFDTFPVIDSEGRLLGVITNHQIQRSRVEELVVDKMIPRDKVVVSSVKEEINIKDAYEKMLAEDINTLPVVDEDDRVAGMYLFSDAQRVVEGNGGTRNVDEKGRYVGDIAVPTNPSAFERVELCKDYLINGGGVVVIDTAHGESPYMFRTLTGLKDAFPDIDFMAGNVIHPVSTVLLARAGADGIKIGKASGDVCDTNEVTGIGRGQITAVADCSRALREAGYGNIPVCSDGGVKYQGDPSKAIVVGAMSVMIGSRFGATYEAPGEIDFRTNTKKVRGMASLEVMMTGDARGYGEGRKVPFFPEGHPEDKTYQGPLAPIVEGFRLALRKSLIYAGAVDIESFQRTPIELDSRPR